MIVPSKRLTSNVFHVVGNRKYRRLCVSTTQNSSSTTTTVSKESFLDLFQSGRSTCDTPSLRSKFFFYILYSGICFYCSSLTCEE